MTSRIHRIIRIRFDARAQFGACSVAPGSEIWHASVFCKEAEDERGLEGAVGRATFDRAGLRRVKRQAAGSLPGRADRRRRTGDRSELDREGIARTVGRSRQFVDQWV